MRAHAPAVHSVSHQTVSPLARMSMAVAQVCLIIALRWLLSTDASDATATSVDWVLVGSSIAIPCALAISCWAGWMLQNRSSPVEPRVISYIVRAAQWITLGLLVIALVVAPLAVVSAIVFGSIG